jgi:hypothetical protein
VLSPGEHTNPSAIAAGPSGELYAVGVAKQGTFRGVVRKSDDGGSSWTTLDSIHPSSTDTMGTVDVVVGADGAVFVIGSGANATQRIVRKSDDGGQSWTTVDTVPFDAGPCDSGHLAVDAAGVVYTSGSCDATGWIVRKGDNGGTSWSTVMTYQLAPGHIARASSVLVDATGQVFASGRALDASDVSHWIVRRAATDGNWTTVDDFQLVAGAHGMAPALGAGTRLYALGSAQDTGQVPHWIVRSADPGGDPWTTVSDESGGEATAVHEDPAGTVLVVGSMSSGSLGSGTPSVVTRRATSGNPSWTVTDTYAYVTGKPSAPTHLAADPAGNVYVMVRGVDATDAAHWIVRKLACDP